MVVLVGNEQDWPAELNASLDGGGYARHNVTDLSSAPALLAHGGVRALFVFARPLGASELLVLRRLREASPGISIVAVTRTPTDPDLKRAFESGATAFLSWPASPDALRHAIESGDLPRHTGSAPIDEATTKDAGAHATRAPDPGVTVHDRLPLGHRYRRALEQALRASLRELSGRWDVSLRAVGRILVQVDVAAPDGSRWSLAVPAHQGPEADAIAETVRTGCVRLVRTESDAGAFGGDNP